MMKKYLIYAGEIIAALFLWVLYLWYRISLFIIITRPIKNIDQFGRKYEGDKQDILIMMLFAFFSILFYFIGFWWALLIYTVMLIINLLVYAIWKKIQD